MSDKSYRHQRFGIFLYNLGIVDKTPLTDSQRKIVEDHIKDCMSICFSMCKYRLDIESVQSEIYWIMLYSVKKWDPNLGMSYKSFVTQNWKFLLRGNLVKSRAANQPIIGQFKAHEMAYNQNAVGVCQADIPTKDFVITRRDDSDEMARIARNVMKKKDWRKRIMSRLKHDEGWSYAEIGRAFSVSPSLVREFMEKFYKEARWELQRTLT